MNEELGTGSAPQSNQIFFLSGGSSFQRDWCCCGGKTSHNTAGKKKKIGKGGESGGKCELL